MRIPAMTAVEVTIFGRQRLHNPFKRGRSTPEILLELRPDLGPRRTEIPHLTVNDQATKRGPSHSFADRDWHGSGIRATS
jgi:hypothetical protein